MIVWNWFWFGIVAVGAIVAYVAGRRAKPRSSFTRQQNVDYKVTHTETGEVTFYPVQMNEVIITSGEE